NNVGQSKHAQRPITLDTVLAQLKRLTGDELKQAGFFPPPLVSEPCTLHDVGFSHDSLYLAGRYNKYARDISQTPFAAGGRQLAQTPVSEIIGQPAQLVFKADEVKFVASGREDMDVRMLGNGRPFYLELLNPKQTVVTAEALDDLAKATNQVPQIQARPLCLVAKGDACLIKDGEESKAKAYSCLVWTGQMVGCRADLLALDVVAVDLQ
ncbi:putative tRNA pseudouridine synthase Pus10, partial [Dimargaris xerosporica]